MGSKGCGARVVACMLGILACAAVRPAAADTLTLQWDPSQASNVAGYAVFVSTQPGPGGTAYDAGPQTSFTWNNAVPGQQYYFCVAAYSVGPVFGPCSAQISRYPNLAPSLQNPGAQSTAAGTAVSLRLSASDPEGGAITYGASGLPPGLQIAANTGVISGAPSTTGSYIVTATASDGALADAEIFTWTIVAPGGTSSGSSGSSDGTSGETGGTSGESTGETSGESTGGTSGESTGGTSEDTSDSDDDYRSPELREDTTAPVLTITMPTSGSNWASAQSFVTIGGSASDNIGVRGVEWKSDRGGKGQATGTQTWLAVVPLVRGLNTITLRAYDAAGNSTTRRINVKFAAKSR